MSGAEPAEGVERMPPEPEIWAQGPKLLTSTLRHWLVVVLLAGWLAALGYVVSAWQDPVYEAAAQLIFADIDVQTMAEEGEQAIPADQLRRLNNRANHLRSTEVLERAVERLGIAADPELIRREIRIVMDPNVADEISIVAQARSPELAAEVANAVGESYQELAAGLERQRAEAAMVELDRTIEQLRSRVEGFDFDDPELAGTTPEAAQRRAAAWQLIDLSTRRERLTLAADVAGARVGTLEPAFPPDEPVSPRPLRMAALGLVVGAALGTAYAYWREGRGGVARRPEEARALLGAPLLAQVPRRTVRRRLRPPVPGKVTGPARTQYEFLGIALDHALQVGRRTTVLVTAVRGRREGPRMALNIAHALCSEDRQVVLVDADVRGRQLTRLLHLVDGPGLTELATTDTPVEEGSILVGRFGEGTWTFVPAGTPPADAYRFVRSGRVGRLLERIKGAGASDGALRVVLHGPPLLDVADAGTLAGLADGVVLQVSRRTALEDIRQAEEILRMTGGQLLGFVFVGGRIRGAQRRGRVIDLDTKRRTPVGAVR